MVVATKIDNAVTQKAIKAETPTLSSIAESLNTPKRWGVSLVNQSRVKPFHGSDGNSESLKAKVATTANGAIRNI
ncbi:hypothetical protein GCM10009133_33540 [Cocleimonas flava]